MPEPTTTQLMRELRNLRKELTEIKGILNADMRTPDRLISVKEACELLGKKKSQVYRMIQNGELPVKRSGKSKYMVSFNQLQRYISH